jgi:uncharacterized protein YeaO (DUF488 family)
MIRLKRAYEAPAPDDGRRYLVDRLWPRGVPQERLRLTAWRKELAPSDGVRRAYCHDPALFPEFRTRYRAELVAQHEALDELLRESREGTVTLIYAAKDTAHSNAAVLWELLEEKGLATAGAGRRRRPAGHGYSTLGRGTRSRGAGGGAARKTDAGDGARAHGAG